MRGFRALGILKTFLPSLIKSCAHHMTFPSNETDTVQQQRRSAGL